MGNYPPTAYKPSRRGLVLKNSRKKTSRDGSISKPSSFRKKKIRDGSKSVKSSTTTETDDSCNSSNKYRKFSQSRPIPDDAPAEIKLVRQYLYFKDAHNMEGMDSITAKNCTFFFIDADADMPKSEFYEALKDTYASFPDLHFFWKYMKISGIDSATGCTIVKVRDYYGIGKHTGKPYAFGPYEAIPATGKIVQDENISWAFFVKDGKIVKTTLDAYGEIVGPPGFYSKIGGVIPGL